MPGSPSASSPLKAQGDSPRYNHSNSAGSSESHPDYEGGSYDESVYYHEPWRLWPRVTWIRRRRRRAPTAESNDESNQDFDNEARSNSDTEADNQTDFNFHTNSSRVHVHSHNNDNASNNRLSSSQRPWLPLRSASGPGQVFFDPVAWNAVAADLNIRFSEAIANALAAIASNTSIANTMPKTTDMSGVERTRPLYQIVNNDKKRVAYFYDSDIGNYAYVTGHPMKPHRIRLAHSLVMNYDVYKFLEIYRAKPAVTSEMTQFHTDEYIEFLQKVTPDNMDSFMREQGKYNVGDDCPVFDGLFEFCGISAGGSMEGAARLNREKCDIAINWAGGLHHAKKSEASGFCYVNDIVLAILELLRFKKRVLYVDIDVHHGDGVEEAFYTTDRVMTVSFHKYGEYFPGTGELRDIGIGNGKHYAVNFPLRDGIDDTTYKTIFEPVIEAVMKYYQPEAVVLQCGGDSLSGDRLGCFNLSMRGHANCVNFVRSFGLPTLVLGGGGYTMRNVARTWAYETGRLVGVEMDPVLPYNEYYNYYGPDYELDVRSSNMENANSNEYLEKIKIAVIENLKKTAHAPSVQMQDVPRQSMGMSDDQEAELDDRDEEENADVRVTQRQWEKRVERQDEYEESDDEDIARANGVYKANGRSRQETTFRNVNKDDDTMEIDSGVATPAEPAAVESAPDNDETMIDEAVAEAETKAPQNEEPKSGATEQPAEEKAKIDGDGDVDMAEAAPAEDKETEAEAEAAIKREEIEGVTATEAEPAKSPAPEGEAKVAEAKPAEAKPTEEGEVSATKSRASASPEATVAEAKPTEEKAPVAEASGNDTAVAVEKKADDEEATA